MCCANWLRAHEHVLRSILAVFQAAGYACSIKHVPISDGIRRADLHVVGTGLMGKDDLIFDYTLRHDFIGDARDVSRRMSTSGRIHSEFLRLLYLIADKQASDYFADLDYEPHKEEFCHRRGVFFHQHGRDNSAGRAMPAFAASGTAAAPHAAGGFPGQVHRLRLHELGQLGRGRGVFP